MRKSKALEAQIKQLAVMLTKEKLDRAVRAVIFPHACMTMPYKREQFGWNVSVKIIDALENVSDWERER